LQDTNLEPSEKRLTVAGGYAFVGESQSDCHNIKTSLIALDLKEREASLEQKIINYESTLHSIRGSIAALEKALELFPNNLDYQSSLLCSYGLHARTRSILIDLKDAKLSSAQGRAKEVLCKELIDMSKDELVELPKANAILALPNIAQLTYAACCNIVRYTSSLIETLGHKINTTPDLHEQLDISKEQLEYLPQVLKDITTVQKAESDQTLKAKYRVLSTKLWQDQGDLFNERIALLHQEFTDDQTPKAKLPIAQKQLALSASALKCYNKVVGLSPENDVKVLQAQNAQARHDKCAKFVTQLESELEAENVAAALVPGPEDFVSAPAESSQPSATDASTANAPYESTTLMAATDVHNTDCQ